MLAESEIIYMTTEEIQARIDEIYAGFPYLKDRVLTSDCECCEWIDVKEEHGHAACGAWENLQTWKWMLGE